MPAKITDSYLASILNVQPGAARAYLRDLKSIGLVNEDGSPSDLAMNWRDDEKYSATSEQIFNSIYPDELRASAPAPDPDRQRVIRWFMQNLKIGSGAAGNKAAFYTLLASGELQKSVPTGATEKSKDKGKPPAVRSTALNRDRRRLHIRLPPLHTRTLSRTFSSTSKFTSVQMRPTIKSMQSLPAWRPTCDHASHGFQ